MSAPQLQRQLGLWACVSIVVGSVIGSSIFMKPATMAGQLGSPLLLLLVWVVAGVVSLFGGMINAEVGAALPETGGQYVYFRHMYGDFFAFLFGWACFIVINTAAIAGIAFVFAQYTGYFFTLPRLPPEMEQSLRLPLPGVGVFFPLENLGVKGLAIILILAASAVNVRSLKAAEFVQVFFTALKVAALVLLAGVLFASGHGSFANLVTPPVGPAHSGWNLLASFMAATTGALAAYDGWNNLGYVAGEIREPQKNIPRGLLLGLGICIGLYVLTTEAYLYLLPVDVMKNSSMVAADAMKAAVGAAAGGFIALLVVISTAGATNGNVLPCARVTFAMGRESRFLAWTGRVHPRHHTPAHALWLQGIWASVLVFIGSFDMLMDMFVFVAWVFYGFAAYGIFIVRRNIPAAGRPFKLWGYPILPLVFLGFVILYVGTTLASDISAYREGRSPVMNSVFGLALTALGIPLYWFFAKRRGAPPDPAAD